jgi:hypothetical protein
MQDSKQKLFVVLGMHRSGTSLITKSLEVLGVSLGTNLMSKDDNNNEKGFFEDCDINELNIEILQKLELDWFSLSALDQVDEELLYKSGYLWRAANLLSNKLRDNTNFAFKDPRTAKLLPFWERVFDHLAIEVTYVMTLRHPKSVADSLKKRDGLFGVHSYLLWLGYMLECLRILPNVKCVVVDYDDFIKSPEFQINRIAEKANLEVNNLELVKFSCEILDKNLRHTHYDENILLLDPSCPVLVKEIFNTVKKISLDEMTSNDVVFTDLLSEWNREYSRLREILVFMDSETSLIHNISKMLNQIREENSDLLVQNSELNTTVSSRDERVESLNALLAGRDEQVESLNALLAGRDERVESLNALLAGRDEQVESLNALLAGRDEQVEYFNCLFAGRD